MTDWREQLDDAEREQLETCSMPDSMQPMLAVLTQDYFDDPDWIYERKLDGVRVLVFHEGGTVRLVSRNANNMNDTWPELVEAVSAAKDDDFIADGEIVAFDGNITSFSRLQGRMGISDPQKARDSGIKVYLYLFDLIWRDGDGLEALPLRTRKKLLRETVVFDEPVRFVSHRNEDGIAYREEACEKGWEGVIAKDGNSEYIHGRSKKWLKFKCSEGQELVIGGYTEPGGSRIGFGALHLGYYKDDDFKYAGKVGTGFDDEELESLGERLEKLERKTSPFVDFDDAQDGKNHWVTPKLVAEIGFTEWTDDGKLRHPRYLGLRHDKAAEDVVREAPP